MWWYTSAQTPQTHHPGNPSTPQVPSRSMTICLSMRMLMDANDAPPCISSVVSGERSQACACVVEALPWDANNYTARPLPSWAPNPDPHSSGTAMTTPPPGFLARRAARQAPCSEC